MRKLGWVVGLIGLLLFSMSCDNPTESRSNPYEQHPITWPSLADSPWPIWRSNPMGNGLAFIKGPTKGKILWKYTPNIDSPGDINIEGGCLGIVIDSLDNIYFVNKKGQLISLDKDGKLRWKNQLAPETYFYVYGEPSPLILRNNKIAVSVNKCLFIIDCNGQVIKESVLPEAILGSGFQVDKRGIFYALFQDYKIRAFDSDGNIYWTLEEDYGSFSSAHVPYFLPDGQSMIISTLSSIQKVTIDGQVEWEYYIDDATPVIVNCQGIIYLGSQVGDTAKIICLDGAGSLVWEISMASSTLALLVHQTILFDGGLVFPVRLLKAISPEAQELWRISPVRDFDHMNSDLVSDINGNVFGITINGDLYSINKQGTLNWIVETQVDCRGSLALNKGILYLSDFYTGDLYAIE